MSALRKVLIPLLVAIVAISLYKAFVAPVYTPIPIVDTNYGKVRGIIGKSRDGRTFHKFMGLRYAKAPVNELRFESPQPPEPWDDVFDGDNFGNECAQIDFLFGWQNGEEDCLFLNVYTPVTDKQDKLYPVIVFIHGGILISGSSNMFGPEYFMDHDLVLVTINYRLASLGFLNTGDGLVRGNMGLKDQRMALSWVQQNIAKFGGDSKSVTLFGNNAGGTSVHYHMMSKMSEGLFQRAITQSSSALGSWALQREYKRQAERYARQLNCTRSTGKEVVTCLKQLPVSQILNVHSEVLDMYRDPISLFAPTLEVVYNDSDTFLTAYPIEIMRSGAMQRKPWMAGFTSHEGLFFSGELMKNQSKFKEFNDFFTTKLGRFLYIGDRPAEAMSRIKDFYFGRSQELNSLSQIQNFTNLGSDLTFTFGMYSAIELQSLYGPVYPYYYTFHGENTVMDLLMNLNYQLPPSVELGIFIVKKHFTRDILGTKSSHNYGPCGTDDLLILFKILSYEIGPSDRDYKFSKKMVKIIADFARDENSVVVQGKPWLPFSDSNKKFLKLDEELKMINPPNQDRFNFLKTLKWA